MAGRQTGLYFYSGIIKRIIKTSRVEPDIITFIVITKLDRQTGFNLLNVGSGVSPVKRGLARIPSITHHSITENAFSDAINIAIELTWVGHACDESMLI